MKFFQQVVQVHGSWSGRTGGAALTRTVAATGQGRPRLTHMVDVFGSNKSRVQSGQVLSGETGHYDAGGVEGDAHLCPLVFSHSLP